MKAVILAGGTGTRLWPLSRHSQAKQFQRLASERTLFQEAIDRLNFLDAKDIYIATNREFVDTVKEQAPSIPESNIIPEPALRDTASCIGLAAAIIAKDHPEEVMAVVYADHLIQDKKEYTKKLQIAEQVARNEHTLNIIEVTAKFPNVNLGYVRVGEPIQTIDGVDILQFKQFTEKPDLKTAKAFIDSGDYLWNTGFYVWELKTILDAYKTHLPDTYNRIMKIQDALGSPNELTTIESEYPKCQKISIDYAIMEKVKAEQVRIIPADLGWSDIGTWLSLHEELTDYPTDNITLGDIMTMNTTGSVLHNTEENKKVVALGLENMIVVNTPDALLICPKNRSQDVKKIVEELNQQKRDDLL